METLSLCFSLYFAYVPQKNVTQKYGIQRLLITPTYNSLPTISNIISNYTNISDTHVKLGGKQVYSSRDWLVSIFIC